MAEAFDIAVIGAGPGGYVAAIRAAQLGMKTAIVEREHLGGICLNWGCIPTKALLRTGGSLCTLMRHARRVRADGRTASRSTSPRWSSRSRKVAEQLSSGVAFLMKKHKIAVIDGTARLKGEGHDRASKAETASALADVEAKHIILATGARRAHPARARAGWQADLDLQRGDGPASFTPKSLLVVGSGAIGIEFASFYSALGAKVTVVEVLDRILPVEDEEISAFAHKAFEKQGMKIHTGTKVEKLEQDGEQRDSHADAQGRQDRRR